MSDTAVYFGFFLGSAAFVQLVVIGRRLDTFIVEVRRIQRVNR